jgi:hypothetical protein
MLIGIYIYFVALVGLLVRTRIYFDLGRNDSSEGSRVVLPGRLGGNPRNHRRHPPSPPHPSLAAAFGGGCRAKPVQRRRACLLLWRRGMAWTKGGGPPNMLGCGGLRGCWGGAGSGLEAFRPSAWWCSAMGLNEILA